MRLFFGILNYPPSNLGGTPVAMENIIRKLSEKHQIFVLATSYGTPIRFSHNLNKLINEDGYSIMYVRTKWRYLSLKYLYEMIRKIFWCDQVHLSSIFFPPNLVAAFIAVSISKKVIWSSHGELFRHARSKKHIIKSLYLVLLRCIKKRIIFRATSIEEAKIIEQVLSTRMIKIIPNFMDIQKVGSVVKRNNLLFLGRITPIKRIENIIRACHISIGFNEKGYKLIISGEVEKNDQKYKEYLQSLLSKLFFNNKVNIIGHTDSPEKEILLAESRALILTSDSENFGNVVVEALAQGTPVIASKGTPWSILEKTSSGFWINNSPEEIALAIEAIVQMKDVQYYEYCNNAFQLSKQYQSDFILHDWEDLINN